MGMNISRFVEIEVINKTQNITLRNPRIHFFSGRILHDPKPSVAPGSSSSCRLTNKSVFWGCNGVLSYEAKSFTLAIFFSNPIDYNRFSVEMGLELSLDKVHKSDLEATYHRLVRSSQGSSDSSMFPCVILKENQDHVQLSLGPVTVTATMVRGRSSVIRVEVEEQKELGEEAEGEKPRHGEGEKPRDVEGEKPQNVEGEKPRDAEGEKPREAEGEKPQDVEGEKPRDVEGEKSWDDEGEKPRDVEGEKSWDFKGDTPKRSESLQDVLQDLKKSPGTIRMA